MHAALARLLNDLAKALPDGLPVREKSRRPVRSGPERAAAADERAALVGADRLLISDGNARLNAFLHAASVALISE